MWLVTMPIIYVTHVASDNALLLGIVSIENINVSCRNNCYLCLVKTFVHNVLSYMIRILYQLPHVSCLNIMHTLCIHIAHNYIGSHMLV